MKTKRYNFNAMNAQANNNNDNNNNKINQQRRVCVYKLHPEASPESIAVHQHPLRIKLDALTLQQLQLLLAILAGRDVFPVAHEAANVLFLSVVSWARGI